MTHDHNHAHDHTPWAAPSGRAWLRVGLWLSLSGVALWVLLHGQTDRYINPNVRWTLWLAIIVALVLASVESYTAWQRGEKLAPGLQRLLNRQIGGWRGASYGILFIPFVAGIFVAPSLLGADSILANDGVVTLLAAPLPNVAASPLMITSMNLLQLQDRLRTGAPLVGDTVRLTGFVYHQRGLPVDEWLLTRFITPHCVAEAQPIALLVKLPTGRAPPNNTWETLTGILAATTLKGHAVALLTPKVVQTIPTPPDPYLIY